VKTGYFKLKDGSIVAFDGSFNESDSGHHYHIDQTQVWRSWEPGDQERLQDIVENIDDDWCGNNRYIHLFPMSKEALDLAERLSPRERPRVRDYTIERLPVAPSSSPPRLRDYQEVSLQRWKEAGFKGIISLATGTGKTRVAIEAIKRFNQKYVNGLAVVTVPYQPLAAQWINELNSQGIATLKVYESSDNWMRRLDSIVDSYVRGAISGGAPVLVCVNKSFLDEAFQSLMRRMDNSSEKKIFIADECHHLNRKNTIEQLPDSFDFRLGLSATPYDRNEPRFLQKYFGEIVAEYLLKDAIRDGYLTPYYYFPIFVQFSEEEASRYIEIAEQIGGRFTDENERYAILESSEELNAIAENVLAKVIELERLLVNQGRSAHSLFYCGAGSVSFPDGSRVRQIHMVTSLLARLRWSVNQITADENQSDRENIIRHFDRKSIDAIASIRILDEGIDVPNCSQAFILASQRSDRQGIQRRGRLLRIAPGKKHASLYDFILTGPRHSSRDLDRFYEREIRRARMFANDAINYNECNSRIDTEIR
jgi:superfamily II DNA or RNA helicase